MKPWAAPLICGYDRFSSVAGDRPLSFDPSLLQPIVRSKRTPMACVECRRRQVKCSGTTPRCERCQKKGIECTYMSLSEQRAAAAATGGSISRSVTPQRAHSGGPSQPRHQRQDSRHSPQAQWMQGAQGYQAGTTYPAPQGWREPDPQPASPTGRHAQQIDPTYVDVQMGYSQTYAQHAVYLQSHAGPSVPGGSEAFTQGYGTGPQQGYASGTTYDAYGHAVPTADLRYAYQAMQMGGVMGSDQQTAAYGGQFAPQVYYDQTTGQVIPADVAAVQQWTENTQVRDCQSSRLDRHRKRGTSLTRPRHSPGLPGTGLLQAELAGVPTF
ncbi:hypothetical protein BD414DRAFT_404370 [Trametes punicea]|nr:hypothetical protein BD414DRAFT_404370 [Trametes punicea]